MFDARTRQSALAALAAGETVSSVSRRLSVSRSTIRAWRDHPPPTVDPTHLVSCWKHWPCLFPQHGPGRKHLRPIVLADWQQEIVAHRPEPFLRGLFLSDGCRVANWTTNRANGEVRRYEYTRYMFSNESTDIMRLCQWALDLLDVPWRMPRRNALSVARREAVAVLDRIVGPKS